MRNEYEAGFYNPVINYDKGKEFTVGCVREQYGVNCIQVSRAKINRFGPRVSMPEFPGTTYLTRYVLLSGTENYYKEFP